jgi:hypothetical protein
MFFDESFTAVDIQNVPQNNLPQFAVGSAVKRETVDVSLI